MAARPRARKVRPRRKIEPSLKDMGKFFTEPFEGSGRKTRAQKTRAEKAREERKKR